MLSTLNLAVISLLTITSTSNATPIQPDRSAGIVPFKTRSNAPLSARAIGREMLRVSDKYKALGAGAPRGYTKRDDVAEAIPPYDINERRSRRRQNSETQGLNNVQNNRAHLSICLTS